MCEVPLYAPPSPTKATRIDPHALRGYTFRGTSLIRNRLLLGPCSEKWAERRRRKSE